VEDTRNNFMTVERTNDEELLSGIVKRAWKHSNSVGEAPGIISLAGFKDDGNYPAFIDWLQKEGINVDDGFDIDRSCGIDSGFTLEDLWKALDPPNLSEPEMSVLDIPEEEAVNEVKESLEDLTAINEAAVEAEVDSGAITIQEDAE
jgi:hypothetical protein